MKKSAFITLGACAIASIAVLQIKQGLKRIKRADLHISYQNDVNPSGMFV